MAYFAMLLLALLAVAWPAGIHASSQLQATQTGANPIRKVVTMLQKMQEKVQAEGEKEKELYEKFMCYCKEGSGSLTESISAAEAKTGQLNSGIPEAEAKLVQLKEDLSKNQASREAAKQAMAEATSIREKEAAAYAQEAAEDEANIASIEKAVAALEAGMAGGFLQTGTAQVLRQLLTRKPSLGGDDHEELLAFLSASDSSSYAPQSGEIVGILKGMADEMKKGYDEAMAAEEAAIGQHEALMAAKEKEVGALGDAIELGLGRTGDLAVEIAAMKNDLGETEQALLQDKGFLADLDKDCATKTSEWEERSKTRAEELVALAETIKVLNDDDALELFKKTMPTAGANFVQVQVTEVAARARALSTLHRAMLPPGAGRQYVDFVTLAVRGKKIGFEKVLKMIDTMVDTLKEEQAADESKREYCRTKFDQADDKEKSLQHTMSDLEAEIANAQEGIATLADDIKGLQEKIKALDNSVTEATDLRKAEHDEYVELMSNDAAAKELLEFAKNRLNKYYNPKLYKAPPDRVLTEEERITTNMGGTLAPTAAPGGIANTGIAVLAQVAERTQSRGFLQASAAPPPPPETFGAYTKKSEESGGVIAMIDLLVKELEREMAEAETEEKEGQTDYEQFMKDSAEKRAEDSKMLTSKGATKANVEVALQAATDSEGATRKELAATGEFIASLHAECDWLLQSFDMRKEARAGEIDALGRARAVLSGADYSLLQKHMEKFLRRSCDGGRVM